MSRAGVRRHFFWEKFHGGQLSEARYQGENYSRKNVLGAKVEGTIALGGISSGEIVEGKLFRGKYPKGKSPGGNCTFRSFIGRNCLRGRFPGGNYSEVIIWGSKIRGIIVVVEYHESNCLGSVV